MFQKQPWVLEGAFADIDDAARMADSLGSQFLIADGARLPETDVFAALEAPRR